MVPWRVPKERGAYELGPRTRSPVREDAFPGPRYSEAAACFPAANPPGPWANARRRPFPRLWNLCADYGRRATQGPALARRRRGVDRGPREPQWHLLPGAETQTPRLSVVQGADPPGGR